MKCLLFILLCFKACKGRREGGREGEKERGRDRGRGGSPSYLLDEGLEKAWYVLPFALVDVTLHLVGREGGREGGGRGGGIEA